MNITPFTRRGDNVIWNPTQHCLHLLKQIAHEIMVILDAAPTQDITEFVEASTGEELQRDAPTEPALSYLLPSMSSKESDARTLRGLTEEYLRTEKSLRLNKISVMLEYTIDAEQQEITLNEHEAWEWLAAFNDIRLGLAGELGVENDADAQRISDLALLEPDGSREQACAVLYVMMSWWQDSLLHALKTER